jgi:hypothetical protein
VLDLVHARIARDLTESQFAAATRPTARAAEPEAVAPRAPVRRGTVRVLRRLADSLEPAPRHAPQS